MSQTSQHRNSGSASPMFRFIARTVILHPWYTIVSWLIGVGIVLALAPTLSAFKTDNNGKYLPNRFHSVQAQNGSNKYFLARSGGTGALVISRQDGAPLRQADQTKAACLQKTSA